MGVRVVSLFSLGSFLLSLSANALDPIKLKIPCGTEPWLICAELRNKLVEGEANATFPGGLKVMVREMLDDVYLGKVRMGRNLVGQDQCADFDQLSAPPICSPLKIPENGCADESVNSYKTPTGVSAACPPISRVGAASDDHPLFSLGRSSLGSRESANVAAGLVMAISEQGAQLKAEITRNEVIFPVASPCYARAEAVQNLIVAQSDVRLIERIRACDPNDTTQTCSAKEYFKAGLTTILSAYLQVARCRLSEESSRKFIEFTSDPGSPKRKGYSDVLKDLYVQACFYPYRGDPGAMRSCYARKYGEWIRARARAAFPNVAAGCP